MRIALGLLAVALLAMVAWQWRAWPPDGGSRRALGRDADTSMASPLAMQDPMNQPAPLPEKDDYAVVTERPLFRSDRRPLMEESADPAAAEAEPTSDIDGLDLNAVLITSSQALAWVRDPVKKRLVRLRAGDTLAGWSVNAILSDRVVLEREGEEDTLILRDYSNSPPSSAAEMPSRGPTRTPRASTGQSPARSRFDQSSQRVRRRPTPANP